MSLAVRSQWRRSAAAIGSPSGRTNAGASPSLGMPSCSRSSMQRRASGVVGKVGHAPGGDLLRRRAARQQRLAHTGLPRDEGLALKQLAQGVELALGLPRKGLPESLAPPDRSVDLIARVVVLEDDRDVADLRQPAHGVACVGGHEVREVRRALRRRQPQPDVDVPLGRDGRKRLRTEAL